MPTPELRIFYGPPGTGKTFAATREAVRLIDGVVDPDPSESARRHRELVEVGRIRWVTFHPSYAYEDFVEGFRPHHVRGRLTYRVEDGPFKLACTACRTGRFHVGQRLGRYEIMHVDARGLVLRSEVRREDRVGEIQHTYVDFWTIERFQQAGFPPEDMSVPGPQNERKQQLARTLELPAAFWAASSPYRAVYEALLQPPPQPRPVVLIIDEINRADLSRVLGELITLLEPDKRSGGREETSVNLPYSRTSFTVPMELSVLGTMNTADKSLSVFDLALRRRFKFQEVEPRPELSPHYGGVELGRLLAEWNTRIELLRSRDYRIGHSDLMPSQLEHARLAHGWDDSESGQLQAVASVLRTKIMPLLLEYFLDDWRKANIVVGGLLLEPVRPGHFSRLVEETLDIDVAEDASYRNPDWWDPQSHAWDGQRFRGALEHVHNPGLGSVAS